MATLSASLYFNVQRPSFQTSRSRQLLTHCCGLKRTRKALGPRCSLQSGMTGQNPGVSTENSALYEVRYKHQSDDSQEATGNGRGWIDAAGNIDERQIARFRLLAVLAADRGQMHNVLANQRSNWCNLFHTTITIAAATAATAAAINGAEPALGLTVVATSLNLACAAFMALVNEQQPSQLAEEQRRAARFFRRLEVEIEAALQIEPHLREEASWFWKEKVGILRSLDEAFPLPLTPNGLPKFPQQVRPPELSASVEGDSASNRHGFGKNSYFRRRGWTEKTEEYLKQTMDRLQTRDIPGMISWAEKAKRVNLAMAKTSPFLAAAAAVCSITDAMSSIPAVLHISWLAATLTVGALFAHSVSHALQLGGSFEMFRNYAGYYAEIERAIDRTLELPAHMREDWTLFLQRINLQLGHEPSKSTVKRNDHPAGKLF